MTDVLSDRALNRATLARQHLLERSAAEVLPTIEHLVGLQAQEPYDPYLALWSRLRDFDPGTLARLLEERQVVRLPLMRATIHLVTAADAGRLRPVVQPVLDAELARHREYGPQLAGVEVEPVLRFAHDHLTRHPASLRRLRAAIAEAFPGAPAAALAYACRCLLPLVQVPPRGVWQRRAEAALTPLDTWLDQPAGPGASREEVVRRYLAAFGPATAADASAWCRLTGLRPVLDRLAPTLRPFRDERGRQLFDLPDAPRPDPDTPAPVRYLPEYDNVVLSHADRSRFLVPGQRPFDLAARAYKGTALVDGFVAALWWTEHDAGTGRTTLVVDHRPLPAGARAELEAEGLRMVRFWRPEATDHDVRLVAAG